MLHLFFDGDIRREGKSMEKNSGVKLIAQNKKAYHDYFVLEKLEAGIELFGTEVKSIREGRINLKDSWCFVKDGEMLANGVHISPYEHGNIFNRDPLRTKRLLLHKKEIRRLYAQVKQEGLAIIPLSVYFKNGRAKLEIGLCKGKKLYDKRETAAKKDAQRAIERNLRKIARNRRALDEKLQKVKNSDKALTGLTEKYQKELEDIKSLRESIIASAMQEAEQIVKGAGKQVEKTIRDIKAAQAEKTQTKEAREELQGFLGALEKRKEKEGRDKENYIDRKLASLQKRGAKKAAAAEKEQKSSPLKVGEKVRIKDNGLVGEVSKISNKAVTVIVGNISSTMSPDRVERISSNEFREASRKEFKPVEQKVDRSLTDRRLNFSPELDIRGERLSDALNIVTRYIDDAVMLNMGSVRIIHGKGSGVLREEIQKYLRSIPGLSVSDEDIRNGGTGVTIVKL